MEAPGQLASYLPIPKSGPGYGDVQSRGRAEPPHSPEGGGGGAPPPPVSYAYAFVNMLGPVR